MSQTGVIAWSTTAASNATADSAVNFAEGMAPSAVNDSARGLMASGAKYYKDIVGTITTGGTSTAYTATSNQVWAALTDGYAITLQMSVTCGASPTLAVDSLAAKPIQKQSGTVIATGSLIAGGLYTFVYRSSPDAFIVHGLTDASQSAFASGTAIIFYQDAAPTGWTITNVNDYALRIVQGSGNSGGTGGVTTANGSVAFSTAFGNLTLTVSNLPDHTVSISDPGHTHSYGGSGQVGCTSGTSAFPEGTGGNSTGSAVTGITASFGTTARGGAQSAITQLKVQYASCIIASKN
jgi:hypothetical protein